MQKTDYIEKFKRDRARQKVKALAGFYRHFFVYIVVCVILVGIDWYQLGPGKNLFTFANFSTPIYWGIVVVFHALGVFGTNMVFGTKWEARKINEIMNSNNHGKWE